MGEQLFGTEMIIFHCRICGSNEAREEIFDEVFKHNGKHVLVQGVSARVCVRCGDKRITYSNVEQNSERFLTTKQTPAPRSRGERRVSTSKSLSLRSQRLDGVMPSIPATESTTAEPPAYHGPSQPSAGAGAELADARAFCRATG